MALKLLQPGTQPVCFDGLDTEYLTLLGGEVVTLTSVTVAGTDKAVFDAYDGYLNPSGVQRRPVVTKTLSQGSRPLMLADEGIAGYGTLFGSVVGGVGGKVLNGQTLGPHTATGSGKVTCWDKPGLYAVTLDACDTNATTGLQPTHPTLTTGAALYATTAGLLTPNSGASFEVDLVVGRFVEFSTNGSLVTTPNKLVNPFAVQHFDWAVFFFTPNV